MLDGFGEALQNHLDQLPKEKRQEIRARLQRKRTRSTADRRGKAAFLYLLDEADKRTESNEEA